MGEWCVIVNGKITLLGPGSDSLAPGQVGVRTGRLSPGDKGVNMKLTIDN